MKQPSTRHLDALPGITELKKLCQSIATLDAIICPEWEYRYYSYNSHWGEQQEMASMRDGSGDEYYIIFNPHGALIYGLAHESPMSPWRPEEGQSNRQRLPASERRPRMWPGVIDAVPEAFQEFIQTEPVKSTGATFCIWRHYGQQWQIGDITFPSDAYADGSADLLLMLDGQPATYRKWAVDYYEERFEGELRNLPLPWVKYVYQHQPITREFVRKLNPALEDWDQLANELREIGYLQPIKK